MSTALPALPATVKDVVAEYMEKSSAIADEIAAAKEAVIRLNNACVVRAGAAGYEPPCLRIWDKSLSTVRKMAKSGALVVITGSVRQMHRSSVERAWQAGEDVPRHVLDAYPDIWHGRTRNEHRMAPNQHRAAPLSCISSTVTGKPEKPRPSGRGGIGRHA